MTGYTFQRNGELCTNCRFCITSVSCPSPQSCIGCKACYLACPHEAIRQATPETHSPVTVTVDGNPLEVPGNATIKQALEALGYVFSRYPDSNNLFAPCETGGCYACAVFVDGELLPSCHTGVRSSQRIETKTQDDTQPLRIVGWHQAHTVGGVGTPWTAKQLYGQYGAYSEAACFAAGCNLRCRTCQNFSVTYNSAARAVTPKHAASRLLGLARRVNVKRLAISGGEATLNRPWLLGFFSWLSENSPSDYRLHLDTNATILTPDYIDDLVEAGITDIGPDVKSVSVDTFQIITGIADSSLAETYLSTEWDAVKHLADNYYPERVFMGVGLPFNPAFYELSEVMDSELQTWGTRIAAIDDRIQVTVLDYRPQFRRHDISRPPIAEMRRVKALLEDTGLQTVIAQTSSGHLPPSRPAPDIEQ
ncbi:MAG: radical SAM protein [Candidatus Thorarchaeota archaeon]